MRRYSYSNLRALKKSENGLATTEFAFILPIMIMLFFGMLEAADAFTVSRRVSNASNAIVDLVGQSDKTTASEIDSIFTGAQRMLEPNDISTLEMKLTSVIRDPNDQTKIIVQWSRDNSGGEPYPPGDEFTKIDDQDVVIDDVSVLVAEAKYTYTSGLSNRVLGAPLEFEKKTKRWPRLVKQIPFCPNSNPDC